SAQIREILISESAWEEMTCLFAPSLIFIMSIEESIKETLNSGYMLYRVAPITEGEAAAFMDVLKQLLLFEDNFRLFGRDLVYKIEKLKIR
ncbi:hypothetical protein AB9X86_01320, partial [Klebsiella pneumoniae]